MSLDYYLMAKADVGKPAPVELELFSRNITHNLGKMWREAGVYDALYNSDGDYAIQHIATLEGGLADMLLEPEKYKKLNPLNGWGDYEGAIEFLKEVLNRCREYPKAIIRISA